MTPLSEEEREELASDEIDLLKKNTPSERHPAWAEEIRRRLAQVDSGEVTPLSWDEVKRLAWEAVDRGEASDHD